MTTPDVERLVLDTNVLLTATDEGRPQHHEAMAALEAWPAAGITLYTTGQILREYLVVATRPEQVNGLGLAISHAVGNVRTCLTRMRLLAEDDRVTTLLLALLDDRQGSGKHIHDANIVAVMLVHGIETIVTQNPDDFRRYDSDIRVLPL